MLIIGEICRETVLQIRGETGNWGCQMVNACVKAAGPPYNFQIRQIVRRCNRHELTIPVRYLVHFLRQYKARLSFARSPLP